MLKREIKYENLDGEPDSDIFYFNISKAELLELEVSFKQGFAAMIQGIVESKDAEELVRKFKEIVLMAYGVKSEDGKRFIKSDQLREEFTQMPAYSALFMELATVTEAGVEFMKGILPKDMQSAPDQDKPVLPSTSAASST